MSEVLICIMENLNMQTRAHSFTSIVLFFKTRTTHHKDQKREVYQLLTICMTQWTAKLLRLNRSLYMKSSNLLYDTLKASLFVQSRQPDCHDNVANRHQRSVLSKRRTPPGNKIFHPNQCKSYTEPCTCENYESDQIVPSLQIPQLKFSKEINKKKM